MTSLYSIAKWFPQGTLSQWIIHRSIGSCLYWGDCNSWLLWCICLVKKKVSLINMYAFSILQNWRIINIFKSSPDSTTIFIFQSRLAVTVSYDSNCLSVIWKQIMGNTHLGLELTLCETNCKFFFNTVFRNEVRHCSHSGKVLSPHCY